MATRCDPPPRPPIWPAPQRSSALPDYGLTVIEVDRPDRSSRRRNGKSDPLDAESAARAVQSGRAIGIPKSRDAQVGDDPGTARGPPWCDESPHPGRCAARCDHRVRSRAGPQFAAEADSRQRIRACAAMRPGTPTDPAAATNAALRSLARRWQALQTEIDDLDAQLTPLVTAVAPQLVALPGVGVDTAGQLLVTAGDNPGRLRSERSSAACAASRPSRCPRAAPTGTGCTAAATATPTAPRGASRWSGCTATSRPRTT
jgi:transposase